ncbi:MAG: sigma factor-like helix-turn-helix DNA-binding protein [Acidobacteriota bacterium]
MVVLEPGVRRQVFEGIVERIRTMPSPLREVFVLRHYDGRTESQIAEKMGIKKTQVDYLLRQAEQMIYNRVHVLRPPIEEPDYEH